MRIAVLLNKRSGTAGTREEVIAAFHRLGAECEVLPFDGAEDLSRARAAAKWCDVFVAAGGDGTINTAATILVETESEAALGLMPMGTCNDLSRTLDIPAGMGESEDVIVNGRSVPLDLICMDGGRILVNQANGGLSGRIADELEPETKARWGPLGYWRASLDVLGDLPEYDVAMVIDGEKLQTRALNVSVANGRFSGGGVPVAPDADVSDGLMDVVIIESRMRLALLPLLPRILQGTHLDADGVIHHRASALELYSDPSMPFSIDGELEDENPRRFEVLPGRLKLRVPA